MLKMKAFSVSEINQYLKRLLATDPIINRVIIEGEISNFTRHSSGHAYFTLKDEGGKLSCVMFNQYLSQVDFVPKNGDKVHAKGQISIFERDGRYQLYVHELENIGLGKLYIAFEALKKELEAKGYFDQRHKKPLPKLPRKVGVITSPTGAAVRDIISVAQRRSNLSDIILYPVRVQGEYSKDEIVNAIEFFNTQSAVDVIILGRGGGSIEELWSFNEPEVAKAIFTSKIPIISGVGHETDFTISDFVADLRAATPSAAAELAIKSKDEVVLELNREMTLMAQRLKRRLTQTQNQLNMLGPEMMRDRFLRHIKLKKQSLDNQFDKNHYTVQTRMKMIKELLEARGNQLHALSPLSVMNRGYSVVKTGEHVVSTIQQVKKGDTIEVLLQDGSVYGSVTKVKKG